MSDTMESLEATETGDLSRTIAVAGLQVSQAADELQAAAERLMGAEQLARDAETRAHTAEDQLAQGATKNAELLDMLQQAQAAQTEAEDRMRRAEQRLQQLQFEAEDRVKQAEREAEQRSELVTEHTRALERQLAEVEARAAEMESRRATEAASRPNLTIVVDVERAELAEAIAAEVRRPLTSILGLTLALKHADPSGPEGRDMVRQLSANARKLDRLLGEMLEVDKIADGSLTPNLRRTDLEALVRRVVEECPDLSARDLHLQIQHVAWEVDPALAEQMIESLLSNAVRRTAPGNPVWVKLVPEDGGVLLAVDDTSSEVPAGLRQAVLSTLSEEHGARATNGARGATGLPLLSALAEIHGGRAWAEQRDGGGASFRFFLPEVRIEEESDEAEDEDVSVVATEASLGEPAFVARSWNQLRAGSGGDAVAI
jgi:signal transduction histidine kinase